MKMRASFAVALSLAVAACSSKNLTRDKAKAVIEANKEFAAPLTSVRLRHGCDDTAKALEKDGLVTRTKIERRRDQIGAYLLPEWRTDITSEGAKYFKSFDCGFFDSVTLVTPLKRRVREVTGIADAGSGQRTVKFIWDYASMPDQVARAADDSPQDSSALLRLYDDGWRAESILVH
jgi:hypothetical protein